MKHKSLVLLILLALLSVSGLATVVAQDTMAPVDLILWSQDLDADPITQAQFDKWAEMYAPGSTLQIVNIENEELRNQVLAQALTPAGLPDMIWGPNDSVGVYVDAGLVQPLDELVDFSLYNGTQAGTVLDGMNYAVPITSGNHLMLMYNKSLVETAPDTWEDLIATAKAIQADNPDVQGFAYNLNEPFWFLPFVGGFGGSVFDEEGNFTMDTEAWINAFQFVHDLKFVEEVVPTECDYDCADSLFKEGSVAMILNGDWSIQGYLDTEAAPALGADNLGLAPWPMLPNGSRPTPYTSGKFISIPVSVEGEHLDAAVAFLAWLTTDEAAVLAETVDIGRLPALVSAYDLPEVTDDPLLSASGAALLTGIGMPANVEIRCMWDSVRPNLEGVMNDSVTAEDAAAESQFAAEDCLAAS